MNIANIKYYDISNGDGVRTSIFVSGCDHHCKGCFNEIAWDYNYGKKFNIDILNNILNSLDNDYIAGASILGGEPLAHKNLPNVMGLIYTIKEKFPEKNIWLYSGYTWEEITNDSVMLECISICDVLVDGRFIESLKDISLIFRGSSNQRIIDVKKSLEQNEVILYKQ